MNQVLLTNEHGDVFKRQITIDECDSEPFDEQPNFQNENIPASPIESEYFYEQYIDYPLNETTAAQTTTTYEQAVGAVAPSSNGDGTRTSPLNRNDSRNHTLLNYNQYKLHQMHPNRNGVNGAGNSSPFTFFGMPLPSLNNLWSGGGGDNTRKSNSRADVDANGKSRLRNYRPRPGEIVDGIQFATNMRATHRNNVPNQLPNGPPPPQIIPHPNQNQYGTIGGTKDRPYPTYYQTMYFDPKIEKGGFVPMVPDGSRKGFTPIENPFGIGDASSNETDTSDNGNGDVQETVSTELKPNVNVEFDEDDYSDEGDDTKYSVRVPTVSPASSNQPNRYNVSSLKKGQTDVLTTSSTGVPLIRNTATPNPLHELLPRLTSTAISTIESATQQPNKNDQMRQNIQKISAGRTATETAIVEEVVPTTSVPMRSTTIISGNKSASANVSSTVAKGNPPPIRTPPGRSVITKVFTSTSSSSLSSMPSSTSTQSPAPILPTAEEYLRTTSLVGGGSPKIGSNGGTTSSSTTTQRNNDIGGGGSTITYKKADLEWYYRNYNRTILKEPHTDAELNRLQSNANEIHRKLSMALLFSAILFTTQPSIGLAIFL